jgi:hypothetical protein
MISIEVGPGDTAEIIAQRHPDVFKWQDGAGLIYKGGQPVKFIHSAKDGKQVELVSLSPEIARVDVVKAEVPFSKEVARNPLADVPEITLSRLPQLEYQEPVKVKPRSKRGQRKRMWR